MKVMGQEQLVGADPNQSDADSLLRYTLSLPVAAAVVGMPQLEMIRHNAAWARTFRPMAKDKMSDFSRRMSGVHKLALDCNFAKHVDS